MNKYPQQNNPQDISTDFSFVNFLRLCADKWWWFAICLVVSVGVALFYLYTKQPKYKRFEQILVTEQDSKGGINDITNSFTTLGLFSKNTNVYNELITMISPAIMYEVADTLNLDMNYSVRDGLRLKTLYGRDLPFQVKLQDIDRQEGAALRIKVNQDGSKNLLKFVSYKEGVKTKLKGEITLAPGATSAQTPLGLIEIIPNPSYSGKIKEANYEIRVSKLPMQATVEEYGKKLYGDLVDQDADVIELSIEDVSVQRAVDILNYIITVYNNNWIEDKNRMAVATSLFIDDRLRAIQSELGGVDRNIADYMKKSGVTDIEITAQANLELGSRVEEEAIKAANQLSVAQYLQDFINNESNLTSLLPVNMGIENPELAVQINRYNELLMARNTIMENSSASNPLVVNYDNQLQQLRNVISTGVNNQVNNLRNIVSNLNKEMNRMSAKMAKVPEDNLPLLGEERQQMVKESLYLFLLQKKEENELTRKFSADNIRVITPPMGSLEPVSPKKALIIIVACILGLGVPFLLLYYLEASDTTVRSKKDLENIMPPFAGEIPLAGKKNHIKTTDKPLDVVKEGKRDVVNEAFRVVRGNLDFMSGRKDAHQAIMFTSFNPGSGKSFIAYNLALSFCLKNKKVLLIDCDMRHGSASLYAGMPGQGLSNYLTGETDNWNSLLYAGETNKNLMILPIGKIPPNPAELLENNRLEKIIEEAKQEFDLVFLDCPPVNIVADTQLVAKWADRTVFIIRAGLLDRSALSELNEFYEEKRFKNLCVILNGTEPIHSRYYTYGNYQSLEQNL